MSVKLNRIKCRKKLVALSLPKIVLDIFDGKEIPKELRYRCDSPSYSFGEDLPDGLSIVPLWECGISITSYCESEPKGKFIKFSLESPGEIRIFGSSFKSVAADLLIYCWEDDISDIRLKELAVLLEFDRIDELIAGAVATNNSGYEKRNKWHADFVSSCSMV